MQQKNQNITILNNFKKKGLRLTVPRKVILDMLCKTDEHPSAEEIYFSVHKNHPNIGLTTVYRTLELLMSWGIVHKFDFGEGKSRYELIDHPKGLGHHHHLICANCKKIVNYTDFVEEEMKLIAKLEKRLSKKHDFIINNHVIEFYGYCNDCK